MKVLIDGKNITIQSETELENRFLIDRHTGGKNDVVLSWNNDLARLTIWPSHEAFMVGDDQGGDA